MTRNGHGRSPENIPMICETFFVTKSKAGLARQRPVSPKPPHLLSHVFAHLYNLK